MQARLTNPAILLSDTMQPLQALGKIAYMSGKIPAKTLGLVHVRVSQINGCAACLDRHFRQDKASMAKGGEVDERQFFVATWREHPSFSDAERAALALAEAETRLADREDPVGDAVWKEATRHYDEQALATLVLFIGMVNLYNRLNVTTRQVPGAEKWLRRRGRSGGLGGRVPEELRSQLPRSFHERHSEVERHPGELDAGFVRAHHQGRACAA